MHTDTLIYYFPVYQKNTFPISHLPFTEKTVSHFPFTVYRKKTFPIYRLPFTENKNSSLIEK